MTPEQYRLFESCPTPLLFVITVDSYLKGDVIAKYNHSGMHHSPEFSIPEIINEMLDDIGFPNTGNQSCKRFITQFEYNFHFETEAHDAWQQIDEVVKQKRGDLCTFEFTVDFRKKNQLTGFLRWKDAVSGYNGTADPVYEIEASEQLMLIISKISKHLQEEKMKSERDARMFNLMRKKIEERKKYSFTVGAPVLENMKAKEAEEN